MTKIDYNNPHVLKICWDQIDEGKLMELEISGLKARHVALAFPHYLDHLALSRSRRQRKISLVKWAVLGAFITPTLWGVCNHAVVNRRAFEGRRSCKGFVVKFGV